MEERNFIMEGEKIHMNHLHIQDMRLMHDGLNSKVNGQSYEAKRRYEVSEVKKCCSLSWLSLNMLRKIKF